jgi:hypothetical protein
MRARLSDAQLSDVEIDSSLTVYIPQALAEYECYVVYFNYWTSRAPDRMPNLVGLADAITVMKKNDVDCPAFEKIRIPKPQILLTLEDLQNRAQEVIN